MDSQEPPTNTEAELESFRRQWREEVTARSKARVPPAPAKHGAPSTRPRPSRGGAPGPAASSSSHVRQRSTDEIDPVAPHAYHDLGERQHGPRLDETAPEPESAAAPAFSREPLSALEHYEKAVEKESEGRLGDSLSLYRRAFKLDDSVDKLYKAKHFPPSYFEAGKKKTTALAAAASSSTSQTPAAIPKPQDPNPSNASETVPNTAHHSLYGLSAPLQSLISNFSGLSIQGEPPPTDLSSAPPCPIATVPEEILVEILEQVAIRDVASFVRLAQVCKRLAYLVATEDSVWKRLALGHEYGFAAMHYAWTCQVDGKPLSDDDTGGILLGSDSEPDEAVQEVPQPNTQALVPSPYPSYRTLFQRRPRIRFNGCYISTVNYTRAGQASPTNITWNSPIHIVTYYRYIRFLRDGTCISLLTTSEPQDVVPYLYVQHMHKHHGTLPSAPMKDALLGRWRLTGPHPEEDEGTLMVETAGVTPKYMYKMVLRLGTAGRAAKNNKLTWQAYWSYNRLTDDWAEFGLKNDRAFYWSRVKSYGMSWDEKGMEYR
ncbi:hypothetical protein ACEQ8H_001621 [Pleosporales sp. CAS-2024a]